MMMTNLCMFHSTGKCNCNECCAALFPFFSVGNFEFKVLNNYFITNNVNSETNIKYDEYFSPNKLSDLTASLQNNDFYLVHFNVRSLSKNLDKIEEFLCDMARLPDAIAVSETKLNSNSSANISIPNYNFLRYDSPSCAGGVGLYIKDTLQFHVRHDLSLNLPQCEDLWLEIKCKSTDIVIGVIYRHPKKEILSFQTEIYSKLAKLETEKLNYIIAGDININTLEKSSKKTLDYISTLSSIGCEMTINNPTRFGNNCTPSLLDHIYTNISKHDIYSGICAFEISDHLPIFFFVRRSMCHAKSEKKFKRCLKHFVLEEFLIDLEANLSKVDIDSQSTYVNDNVDNLITVFKTVLNRHAPLRSMSRREKRLSNKPWITKGILNSIKTKNRLFRSHFKSNDPSKKYLYKKYLNKLTHIKFKAKQNYYDNLFKTNYKNPSETWSIIRQIIECKPSTRKTKLPSTISIDNVKTNTNSQIFLNKLCAYFANIGADMAKNIPQSSNSFKFHDKSCMKSFVFQEIDEEEVSSHINNIKASSTPGSDEISPKFVKLAKVILSPFLTKLFNKCIQQEIFPDAFKIAHVIPIPKVSSPRTLNELRPISLLPVFSKLFEKILESKMTKFLNKNNILTSSQFGFRTNSSTELAITTLYDKLLGNLNEKKATFLLFLDLKKAFDSVSHPVLLKKLYHYGFRGSYFNFLHSYLTNRLICTKLDGKLSKLYSINYGIPQGSVLGPLFFLLFVNDLPNASNFETTLFADDTNLHLSHNNINTLHFQVVKELHKISQWINANKLTINYKKSCYMIISKKLHLATDFKPTINGNLIEKTVNVKYLGVCLDSKLSWECHIDTMHKKLSKVCGMIYKLRHYVPLSTLKLVYYSMFHSHLQYSLLNWGRAAKTLLHKLEVLQNNILRACFFSSRYNRTNVLYFKFGALKLHDMFEMEIAKFMFKFNNQMLPSSFNNYFIKLDQVHEYKTRQKSRNEFYQPYIGSEVGRKTLHHICLRSWKSIPQDMRHCSFSRFKKYFKSNILAKYDSYSTLY